MGPFFLRADRRKRVIRQATRGIAAARRHGHHTYYGDWHFELQTEARQIAASLLAWCRETLASCRRPFGIDYFDLAIAVADAGDGARESLALKELQPALLYASSLEDRLADFIERRLAAGDGRLHVSTALFSWGDAAHAALPARV